MKKFRSGFTISEISLSMVFISFMLLSIAALVIYATTLYQKGLTLRAVNNTGLELVDEITRSLSGSFNSVSGNYYYQRKGNVYLPNSSNEQLNVPIWGVFCTGTYSYAWNTGYVLGNETYARTSGGATFRDVDRLTLTTADGTYQGFRLLRVNDSNRAVCASVSDSSGNSITATGVTNTRELFSSSSEHQLALYDFHVFTPVYHSLTGHTYYSGSFVIGTIKGSVDITTTSDVCKEASDNLNTDFTYCAINKFNFAVRATGAN